MMVALLAEGVDRNCPVLLDVVATGWSPSSRRAWIEITLNVCAVLGRSVALLAEGVDRNRKKAKATEIEVGRPPRGGRG